MGKGKATVRLARVVGNRGGRLGFCCVLALVFLIEFDLKQTAIYTVDSGLQAGQIASISTVQV